MQRIFHRTITTMAGSLLRRYGEGSQPFTVFIEGNIGSGKTTFLNHFKKFDDICLLTEPVEEWQNCGGVNLLDLLYKEPHRWAMPFQTYVTKTMLEMHTKQTDKRVKLMERSVFSARTVFVENMFRNGTLHKGMYNVLQEWYGFLEKAIHIQADLIIYLRTDPEIVYERMKKRARSEESCVSLDYLKQLHETHEKWLINKEFGNVNIPVFVLDGNLDLDNIALEYEKSEERILKASIQQPILSSPAKRGRISG